jgi:glyoxylase-like metal-dependent hydrolase (beta-lactamase superfamily II)
MIIRQLFDLASSTYSYLLADETTRKAVLIDPVFERHARDAALIRELELELLYTVDTHCHADHVTGAWLMRQRFGSEIALSERYGAKNVDVPLKHGDQLRFGTCALEVRATPGHTSGCVSLVTDGRRAVFTGDALLVRSAGRTDFQEGDAARLYRSIHEQLFTLSDDCVVYPGHDYEGRTSSTIGSDLAGFFSVPGAGQGPIEAGVTHRDQGGQVIPIEEAYGPATLILDPEDFPGRLTWTPGDSANLLQTKEEPGFFKCSTRALTRSMGSGLYSLGCARPDASLPHSVQRTRQ